MKRNLELLAEKLAFKEALDMDSESMVQWVADDLMKVYSDDESILEQTASNYGIDIDDWRESQVAFDTTQQREQNETMTTQQDTKTIDLEGETVGDQIKFQLNWMITMYAAGRDDMAQQSLTRLHKIADTLEGPKVELEKS